MNFRRLTSNRFYLLLSRTVEDFMEDNALRLSAALAYYSIFSIAPLLIIAIYIAGVFYGPDAARGQLEEQLRNYIGAPAASGVQSLVQSAYRPAQGWVAVALGLTALLVGASSVFGQLKDSLNTIWEVQVKPKSVVMDFVRNRLLNVAMVLIIGFLLLTSLLLTAAVATLSGWLERQLGVSAYWWGLANFGISFTLVTTLFAFIFKVLPDVNVAWRHVWLGAAVTSVLFELGKFGLAYYLGRESTVSSYGAAGSLVLLLLWVYYTSCILLFGAEFTQVYTKLMAREKVDPEPGAVPVTAEARAQQGLPPAHKDGAPAQPASTLKAVSDAPVESTPSEMVMRRIASGTPDENREHEFLHGKPQTKAPGPNGAAPMKTVLLVTAAGLAAGAAASLLLPRRTGAGK